MSTASAPASLDQEAHLVQADAVLAAAGAVHRERALHELLVQLLGQLALGRDCRVDQIGDVEVAVADVADDVVLHAGGFGLLRRLRHRLGEARDRHAGVGRDGAAARLHLQAGEVGAVARGPELRALLGRRRPLEAFAAVLARDLLHRRGLLLRRSPRCRGTPSAASAPR